MTPGAPTPRLAMLAEELAGLPWYSGLLVYGSHARGEAQELSDLDVVAVTNATTDVRRIHTEWIDLNLLTIADLRQLADRVAVGDRLPWDSMFEDLRIVDDPTGDLEGLVARLHAAFANPGGGPPPLDPLRFSLQRQLKALDQADASPLAPWVRLTTVLALVAAAHQAIMGRPWQGAPQAMRSLERDRPEVAERLRRATQAVPEWEQVAASARDAARTLFASAGGLWNGGALVLGSDVPVAAAKGTDAVLVDADALEELLARVGDMRAA